MQDITEQQEVAQEISDAISKPVGFGEEFDEVRFVAFGFKGDAAVPVFVSEYFVAKMCNYTKRSLDGTNDRHFLPQY